MKPDIHFLSLEEVKKLSTKILSSDFFSKYFSTRQLADKIIVEKYHIEERYLFTKCEYTPLQKFIKKQLNHIIRWMKKEGYIEKYSNRFWEIKKEKFKRNNDL